MDWMRDQGTPTWRAQRFLVEFNHRNLSARVWDVLSLRGTWYLVEFENNWSHCQQDWAFEGAPDGKVRCWSWRSLTVDGYWGQGQSRDLCLHHIGHHPMNNNRSSLQSSTMKSLGHQKHSHLFLGFAWIATGQNSQNHCIMAELKKRSNYWENEILTRIKARERK